MSQSPFQVRGVVEGFYGVFYTAPERDDLIRFLTAHGFNLYVYAPKNDRPHRNRWREPYAAKTMQQFRQTVALAQEVGITFCYALAPGVSVCYSSHDDFEKLTDKLCAFYEIGVRSFSVLLDDIAAHFRNEADVRRYRSYAEGHIDLCNRVRDWLRILDPKCTLSMCPTDYYGCAPFSEYITELGKGLCPDIDVYYTGPEICSPTISATDALNFAQAVRRLPLIWDNYPVNDLAMQPELHIGPLRGRDLLLGETVKGIVAAPMVQAEASKIPLLTLADYLADPRGYDPERSWENALREIAGEESYAALRLLAENSLYSCLGTPEAEKLATLVEAALTSVQRGDQPSSSPEVQELEKYLVSLDEACDHLKNRMDNLALRNNLLPWIEVLEYWVWTAQRALEVLDALEWNVPYYVPLGFMQEYVEAAKKHHKRMADNIIEPLAEYALERAAKADLPRDE